MSKIDNIDFRDNDTLVIMDTNVWLDLYKLHPTAITGVVESFTNHKNKFWLPYQVYVEFNRNVIKSRTEAIGIYSKIRSESCILLNDVKFKINQKFENLKRNNIVEELSEQDKFIENITETITQLKTNLIDLDDEYQEEIKCISKDDIIQELIESLHKESKTKGFSINQLISIYEEGEIRYKYKVAPGYTDINKKNNENDNDFLLRKYGDLILWKEIINHVKGTNKNLIFVQNEKKSDWWETPQEDKISKVLTEEYNEAILNNGKIHMVDFEGLLNIYGSSMGLPAPTIKEIVTRLKFEKSAYEYIDDTKEEIINEYISMAYEDGSRGYELCKNLSLFGGYVSSVEDFEIDNSSIISSNFNSDKDCKLNYINAFAQIDCTANITEYINKHVYHSGSISFRINFLITVDYSIDFSNLEAKEKDTYEITGFDIQDEEISNIVKNDEFDIDISVDEDMFRER